MEGLADLGEIAARPSMLVAAVCWSRCAPIGSIPARRVRTEDPAAQSTLTKTCRL